MLSRAYSLSGCAMRAYKLPLAFKSVVRHSKAAMNVQTASRAIKGLPKYVGPVLCSVTLAGVGLSAFQHRDFIAQCQAITNHGTRLTSLDQEISEQYESKQAFQWMELVNLLIPEVFYLLGAVIVSIS